MITKIIVEIIIINVTILKIYVEIAINKGGNNKKYWEKRDQPKQNTQNKKTTTDNVCVKL